MSYSLSPWTSIGEHTAIAIAQPHGVNIGLVIGSESAALIDSGSTAQQGAEILASAQEYAKVPIKHLVVTHPHHDHWFGAAGMPGVTVLAHENLTAAPEPEVVAAATLSGLTQLPAPDSTFSMVCALNLGGVRVELMHFGPAHTAADIVAVVPQDDVIFLGDLIESAGAPQVGPASDTASWPKVLDAVLSASLETTAFVPGHGRVVDREFCFQQRAEISFLHGTAEHLFATGVDLDQATRATSWPFSEATVAAALPLIYAKLRACGVKRRLPLI